MKFTVYNGSIGHINETIYTDEGNFSQSLKDHGFEVEPFFRIVGPLSDGYSYIDFGSYSTFVRIDQE